MKFEHEFTVPAPMEEAWKVLLDVERVGPCMPGATVTGVDGNSFTGTVKVKVGPIKVTYTGQATFISLDSTAHRAVINASGRETRGSGTAAATVTAQLDPDGDATRVKVETDLNVTGRPAQFGRGVMAEVGGKLIEQFATNLAVELAAVSPAPVTTLDPDASKVDAGSPLPSVTPVAAAPIDLLDVAGGSVMKRLVPLVAVLAGLLWFARTRRRR